MPIKMRVLLGTEKKKLVNIANAIKAHYELNPNSVDKIPPAYSCDKERIVVLILAGKSELNDSQKRFCLELTKERTANVALMIDGTEAFANHVKGELAKAGTNVIDQVLYVKGGIPFLGSVKPEEQTAVFDWIDNTLIPSMK